MKFDHLLHPNPPDAKLKGIAIEEQAYDDMLSRIDGHGPMLIDDGGNPICTMREFITGLLESVIDEREKRRRELGLS